MLFYHHNVAERFEEYHLTGNYMYFTIIEEIVEIDIFFILNTVSIFQF